MVWKIQKFYIYLSHAHVWDRTFSDIFLSHFWTRKKHPQQNEYSGTPLNVYFCRVVFRLHIMATSYTTMRCFWGYYTTQWTMLITWLCCLPFGLPFYGAFAIQIMNAIKNRDFYFSTYVNGTVNYSLHKVRSFLHSVLLSLLVYYIQWPSERKSGEMRVDKGCLISVFRPIWKWR